MVAMIMTMKMTMTTHMNNSKHL